MLCRSIPVLLAAACAFAAAKHNQTLGEPPPSKAGSRNDNFKLANSVQQEFHKVPPHQTLQDMVRNIKLPTMQQVGTLRQAWDHMVSHMIFKHRFGRRTVCYDNVGCFHAIGKFSQLQVVPDNPAKLDTRFYLYSRASAAAIKLKRNLSGDEKIRAENKGEILEPYTPDSIAFSSYDPQRPTKILLHGYNGRGDGSQTKRIRNALLKKEDANVVSVDWANGARGPNYLQAVANAELVARQVSRLILHMISLGTSAKDIHIIGFSLGAQVAGLAGAALKREGEKIGRITGLDPASFMFERTGLEADKRLDISDAEFVDVIHTDGSLIWSDGFGLLAPVGHVDFFPNGGQNQPGCQDSYVGALKFQIKSVLARDMNGTGLCSHARSVDLFIESLDDSCKFMAFPCPGLRSFSRDFLNGDCFSCDGGVCGEMGYHAAESPGRGALYFVTRNTKPYCGQQVRVTVSISPESRIARGSLVMQIQHGSGSTNFELSSARLSAQALDMISGGQELSALSAAKSGSLSTEKTPWITAAISFIPRSGPIRLSPQSILIDRVTLTTQEGHWWYYCGLNTTVEYSRWQKTLPLIIQLQTSHC